MNGTITNLSTNGTQFQSCHQQSVTYFGHIVMIGAYSLIMVVSLLGNGAVCILVASNSSSYLKSTINYFLVNLALSDLVIPIVVASRRIFEISTWNEEWRVKGDFGNFLCKLVFFVSDMSPIVSILSFLFMSVDRLIAIVFPFLAIRFSQSNAKKYLVVLCWVVASSYCSPYFYAFRLNSEEEYCILRWDPAFDHQATHYGYTLTTVVLFIFIPFLLLTITYSVILVKIRQGMTFLGKTQLQRQKEEKNRKNITYLSLTLVVLFGVCWLPYFMVVFAYNFVYEWDPKKVPCVFGTVKTVAEILAHSNAAINPLIYFLFLRKFRKGLKKLLCACKP